MIRMIAKFFVELSETLIELTKVVSLFLVASVLAYLGGTICPALLDLLFIFVGVCLIGAWGEWYLSRFKV